MLIRDQKENEIYEKIKLNEDAGKITSIDEYILDLTEKYVINIEEEYGM